MLTDYQKQLMKKAIEKWGKDSQYLMLIEELVELQTEVLKFFRNDREINRENLIGEIADVEIMMSQLKIMENISEDDVREMIDFKTKRLASHLDES